MIKEGLVFLNTKNNPCLILKVDDRYCWVFARTTKGFNCNHYGKWYIEQCLRCGNYHILNNYKTWQDAVIGEEFGSREADYKKFISQVGKNLTGRNKVVFQQNTEIENLKELLRQACLIVEDNIALSKEIGRNRVLVQYRTTLAKIYEAIK